MGEGLINGPSPAKTYEEIFWEALPQYIAIGMTSAEFWDGEPRLAEAYKKADEIRQERQDAAAWLQGMYVYEAVCCASPLFHDFTGNKRVRPEPYSKAPYLQKQKEKKKLEEEKRDIGLEMYMARFMVGQKKEVNPRE